MTRSVLNHGERSLEPGAAAPPAWVIPLLVLGAGVLTGGLALVNPLLATAAVVLLLVAFAAVRTPDLATFAVIFILYSNVAVVASHFHGVPRLLASAFPLLLAAPLVRDLVLERRKLILTPALPLLFLLLVVQVLGMLFARQPDVSRSAIIDFLFEGLLLYFLITNVVRTPRTLRLALWALLVGGFVSAVVPCFQQLTGSFGNDFGGFGQVTDLGFRTGELTAQGEGRQLRLAGTLGEQNRFAQNMLMLLPIGLFLYLSESSRRRRIAVLVLAGVVGLGFLLTFSRGGAIAFAIVILTMGLLRLISTRGFLLIGVVALVGLLSMPHYWQRLSTLQNLPAAFSSRSTATGTKPDTALQGRVTEMLAAALVFVDHPLMGVGPGMFKYYSAEYGNRLGIRKLTRTRKAHSLYLEVAAEGGLAGLAVFLGIIGVTLGGLLKARRQLLRAPPAADPTEARERDMLTHTLNALFLALVAYLASGLFLHLAYIRYFYLMLALAGASSAVVLSRAPLAHGDPREAHDG